MMKSSLNPRRDALTTAASCVALVAATGCVSQKEFSQACQQRDQVAAALNTTRADRARLTTELTQTWTERDAAQQDSQDLSDMLQAALDRSQSLDRKSSLTQTALDETKNALAAVRTELTVARKDLTTARETLAKNERANATAREQLAAAQKRSEELDNAVRAGQAALATLRAQARAQAEEFTARIKQFQLDLAEAAKDQAALAQTREKLARAQQSDAEARERLAKSEESGAQLASKLETASADITRLKNEAQQHDVQSVAARIAQAQVAAAANRKIQTELEAARAKQAELQHTADDAKSQLAASQKRITDLEGKVKTLAAARTNTPATEGEAKPASDSTAAINPDK
jgi:DNA repair exonuclease SbcCD ATPase subunit